ncbi:hypothetical protein L207DRAFT_607572 [Hyaloscypha variabilis F]|uniref:Prion-inhibition and propagation HeLo domain-containing protein n=1 Tax=Hyaloscypha variabilis (strain UAMH 11265 / GT02V1 / F) TaxID=1149755 RepID=A0A2J6SAZ9_HYAVF|nr:hypothetical protein L207DRAFT_607572 [Hyaloscypha variabilis F]
MAPVEPITLSLTIGAVSLANLFSLCIQCFDLIEVGCNLGLDYELLIVRLSIEKRRLMIWGEAVGILRPDEDRDKLLDEQETHDLIDRILIHIQKLFHDADAMRSKYGLEKASEKPPIATTTIDGSVICQSLFENSPFAQFQKRVSNFHERAGLITRTRWAIRDNNKFIKLIDNLKDLLDGLYNITTTPRTSILRGLLIRQEVEVISDLRMLNTIEESCSDKDWKSCASAASSYLASVTSIDIPKSNYIHEWIENHKRLSQIEEEARSESWSRHESKSYDRSADPVPAYFDDQSFEDMAESENQISPKLRLQNCPHLGAFSTEVVIMCSTSTLKAWVLSRRYDFDPVHKIPNTTVANNVTYSRIMQAIAIPQHVSSTHIAIYCPPRMRYVHMALRFIGLESPAIIGYRCQIRFDDRLLDRTTSFEGIAERMMGYYRELEEATNTNDRTMRRLLDAIDMNWLEQRIDCLTPPHQPLPEALDWYKIFRQSKDDPQCVGIIIMCGEETCRTLFNTAPVMPPDTFRGEGRVYRLRELEGANDRSKLRWKPEHYCNISRDKDFERLQ